MRAMHWTAVGVGMAVGFFTASMLAGVVVSLTLLGTLEAERRLYVRRRWPD